MVQELEPPTSPLPKAKPVLLWIGLSLFLLSLAVFSLAKWLKPEPHQKPVTTTAPLVEILAIGQPISSLPIFSQGVVKPQLQTALIAEVAGRVVKISEAFEPGAFVKKGQWLLNIEDTDYQANLRAAEAEYAKAVAALEQAQEETRQAEKDWRLLGKQGQANNLALKKPQLAQARASVKSAKVGLTSAEKALERTAIHAPYDGLIAERPIQLEEFVNRGQVLGHIFGTDAAELRLPITFDEYQLIAQQSDTPITLSTERMPGITWTARLHRMEHRLQEDNRMLYLTARLSDPYARVKTAMAAAASNPYGQVPLPFGVYVQANISALAPEPLLSIPRHLINQESQVWVVNPNQELVLRSLSVFYKDRHFAYVRSGLNSGEQLLVSGVGIPLEGMKVRITSGAPSE